MTGLGIVGLIAFGWFAITIPLAVLVGRLLARRQPPPPDEEETCP